MYIDIKFLENQLFINIKNTVDSFQKFLGWLETNFYRPILWNNNFRKQIYEDRFSLILCSTIFEKVFDKRMLFVQCYNFQLVLRLSAPIRRINIWFGFFSIKHSTKLNFILKTFTMKPTIGGYHYMRSDK